jgi:hypothetical protein
MSEFIAIELRLARTLLQLAVTNIDDTNDHDGEGLVIDHASSALEIVRIFLPKASLSETECAYYRNELSYLEGEVQAHPLAAKKSSQIPTSPKQILNRPSAIRSRALRAFAHRRRIRPD